MRANATQLPTADELKEIIAKEARRVPALGKESKHFPDFALIKELYDSFGLDSAIFSIDHKIEDLNQELISTVDDNLSKAVQHILENPHLDIYDKIYDYLSEQDALEKSDLIFVFGTSSNYRIDKAVELYHAGYAKKILVSGKSPIYAKQDQTEADIYRAYAIEKGIPSEEIITEDNSVSIPDNVKSSLNLLDRISFDCKSIILVNSPFAQRRGWAHFSKFTEAKLIRVNCESSEKFKKENWYKQEETIRIFLNEFLKMRIGVILNTA